MDDRPMTESEILAELDRLSPEAERESYFSYMRLNAQLAKFLHGLMYPGLKKGGPDGSR